MSEQNAPQNPSNDDQNPSGQSPTSQPLTPDQQRKILAEQEARIRQHKGDELELARAIMRIDEAAAYRQCTPPFTKIQDYCLAVHNIKYRQWRKLIAFAKVRDAQDAVQRKCPDGQTADGKCPAGHVAMNKAQARKLEPLLKNPALLEQAITEVIQQPLNEKGHISSAVLDEVATKFKKIMVDDKIAELTAKEIDDRYKNWFVTGDMLTTTEIKDDYYDLVITSPPYNLNIMYRDYQDSGSTEKYLSDLEKWCGRIVRALKHGGRAFINLPFTYSKSKGKEYIHPLPCRLLNIMERNHPEMQLYQWIKWDRQFLTDGVAGKWGSYMSCSQPNVRRITEEIIGFAKGTTKRQANEDLCDITDHEFVAWTQDLWTMPPSTGKDWHKCPFPLELPIRIMKLYGQRKDKILDCFSGSGTTALAAALMDRECLSVDLSPEYTDLARRHMIEFIDTGKGRKLLDRIRKRAETASKGKKPEVVDTEE